MVVGSLFTKGSARVCRVVPLRRPRCPVSRSRPASCCKTAKSDGRAWSLEHRRSPHVRSGAVDDRVRDVYYANRPVVVRRASSDDERGRGRAGQRQWPWQSGVSKFLSADTFSPVMRHGNIARIRARPHDYKELVYTDTSP